MDNAYEQIALPGPGDHTLLVKVSYTQRETNGVTVLIVGSSISLVAVVFVLVNILIRLSQSGRSARTAEQAFLRTHISYYFICLMLADLAQAIGSIMSSKWVAQQAVTLTNFCVGQGAIKNAANVAGALWTLVIAIHTWTLLFLRIKPNNALFIATIIGIWSFVGLVVIIGPAAIQNPNLGPYFGISGYWCWIANNYPKERIGLEYFFMFFSAAASFVFYSLVFLRFRGNVVVTSRGVKFKRVKSSMAWKMQAGQEVVDAQTITAMKQMLWYPVVYTIIVFPIALSRFLDWTGHDVPFEATIFSDTVFVLGGFMNSVLFTTTRRLTPISAVISSLFRPKISGPSVVYSGFASRPPVASVDGDAETARIKTAVLDGTQSIYSSSSASVYTNVDVEKPLPPIESSTTVTTDGLESQSFKSDVRAGEPF